MRGSRVFIAVALAASVALGGCSTIGDAGANLMVNAYTSKSDGAYRLPAIPVSKVSRKYRRQIVNYSTNEKPGTIIVDTRAKHLYFVLDGGRAVRYGIGVGREGFTWSGTARVAYKREWPTWTPTPEMIERNPKYAEWEEGMPGGPGNPLGARALYLFRNGRDTYYRIHGTNQPASIGRSVSNGCIRMINAHVQDLYERVPIGTVVTVL